MKRTKIRGAQAAKQSERSTQSRHGHDVAQCIFCDSNIGFGDDWYYVLCRGITLTFMYKRDNSLCCYNAWTLI